MDKKENSLFKKKTGKNTEQKDKRRNGFDKNREGVVEKPEKKPFDKKAYRLKKYSKKYKLEQWEEQRKKRLLCEYHKEIKNQSSVGTYKPRTFDEDAPDGSLEVGKYVRHPDFVHKQKTPPKAKRDPFQQAKEQFNKVKQEKLDKQKEIERAKEEKKKKLEEYKKKKQEKFKKLSRKTKKGQPVMTGRLELLLEKIQRS